MSEKTAKMGRPKKAETRKGFYTRIRPDLMAWLQAEATRENRSVANLIEQCVEKAMKKGKAAAAPVAPSVAA